MNKNICFVANQSKTKFFQGVAKELLGLGINVYWITISDKIKVQLQHEYSADNVLSLDRHVVGDPVADFKLNEIVLSDRSLREQQSWAFNYLNGIQSPIFNFIKKHKIAAIFGEVTWGHEMLILRMTKKLSELDCQYITPHTVRIPSGYFGFFTDEEQSELMPRPIGMDYELIKIELVKPDYLHLNDKIVGRHYSLMQRLKRVAGFVFNKNYEAGNPCMYHAKVKKVAVHLRREVNRELYRFVRKQKVGANLGDASYVLYPLHKQPEASVDVIGRYYDDQYTNILNIWRGLPDGWMLFVKEHSNAVGDRSIFFYKKVARLNNVLIVGAAEDSHELIKSAATVVTVSGTAAYEAALMGKSSLTFAKTFFNKLALCDQITLDQLRLSSLKKIIDEQEALSSNKLNLTRYEDWLSARIFKGIISDPDSNPACMSRENLIRVAQACKVVIS